MPQLTQRLQQLGDSVGTTGTTWREMEGDWIGPMIGYVFRGVKQMVKVCESILNYGKKMLYKLD